MNSAHRFRFFVFFYVLMIMLGITAISHAKEVVLVDSPEVTCVAEEGAGKLYQVGEHPVLVMEGTPEEMGYQHGKLLAKEIHHIIREGYMPKALWNRGYSKEYVNAQSARMEAFFPESAKEELRGITRGVQEKGYDITYEEIRLGITQAEILHFPPDGPPACSNFACWGKWTTDGRLLHGRNLDWNIKGDAQDSHLILVWRPTGGKPFMMIGWAAGIGSVSGMNSQGITMGEMTLPSPDVTFDGLPLFLQMRLLLETCSTLDESVAFMENCSRTTGWNFIIGDGKIPDGRALETDAKYCTVYGPEDEKENERTGHWGMKDMVRRTNHPVGMDQLLRLGIAMGEEFNITISSESDVETLLPLLKGQNTWQRYECISKEIEKRAGAVDVKEAIEMLAITPVYNDATLHSMVFDPTNNVVYVANAGNNPPVTATDRPYTRIDLNPWFK
ncbi:MAG: C45 family peptidase [Candidatus Hydrogenedentales bacterium]